MLRVVWCGKVYLLHVHGQLCLLLFDLMDYSPPGSAVHGILHGVGCLFLLQGMFPTEGSNWCLLCVLHCRQILYH